MLDQSSKEAVFDTETYWQERLSKTYGLEGVGYKGLSRSYNRWLYRVRRCNFRRVVSNYDVGESPRILDIGSGTGFYVGLWEEIGVDKIVGLDIAGVAVQNLRDRFPAHTFLQRDISELSLPEVGGEFDAVSAMDILFHIVDDEKYYRALENIYSLLIPGGYLFFTGNFLHGSPHRTQHIVHRSLKNVEGIIDNIGFKIVSRQPVFVLMNEPVDAPSGAFTWLWGRIERIASRSELSGYWLGAVLYPFELLLTRTCSESPTTEIMVCRKPKK